MSSETPIGNLSHLLVLDAGDALELFAHHLRLLAEHRAELGSQRLACQRLLGACVGQILPQVALEIGAGRGEHLEPRAQIRRLREPRHRASHAIEPHASDDDDSAATTTSATTTTTETASGMAAEFTDARSARCERVRESSCDDV